MEINNTNVFGYYAYSESENGFKKELLSSYGCDKIFKENLTGQKKDRKAFGGLMEVIRKGDTLVIAQLEDLGKTKNQVIDFLFELKTKEIKFKSIKDKRFDTTTDPEALNEIIARLKEMDFQIKSGNIKTGMRPRGKNGGRSKGSFKKSPGAAAQQYQLGKPVDDICRDMKIAKSTLYRYLRSEGVIK